MYLCVYSSESVCKSGTPKYNGLSIHPHSRCHVLGPQTEVWVLSAPQIPISCWWQYIELVVGTSMFDHLELSEKNRASPSYHICYIYIYVYIYIYICYHPIFDWDFPWNKPSISGAPKKNTFQKGTRTLPGFSQASMSLPRDSAMMRGRLLMLMSSVCENGPFIVDLPMNSTEHSGCSIANYVSLPQSNHVCNHQKTGIEWNYMGTWMGYLWEKYLTNYWVINDYSWLEEAWLFGYD